MIATHSDPHALAGHDLIVLVHNGLFGDRPDREDRGLGGIDDRIKMADAEGTEVGNRNGSALHLGWGEFFVTSTGCEVF